VRLDCRIPKSGDTAGLLLKVEIEKLDCVLSKRATRPYIYGHTSANAYVLIYV